jgi:hypothetical protein
MSAGVPPMAGVELACHQTADNGKRQTDYAGGRGQHDLRTRFHGVDPHISSCWSIASSLVSYFADTLILLVRRTRVNLASRRSAMYIAAMP